MIAPASEFTAPGEIVRFCLLIGIGAAATEMFGLPLRLFAWLTTLPMKKVMVTVAEASNENETCVSPLIEMR